MSLTKAEIIKSLTDQNGYTKAQAIEILEVLIEIMKSTLASGDDILVSGFGKFSVHNKAQRKGRNPATGETLMLDARKVVTFKGSGKLRARINS
ncbi:MAG: DNA-binding protein [Desulfatitalea sp. BRH_c12]|nr:MAG: DNA-binding protein [Desulfatitalea sp. BRH_c12]